MPGLMSGAAQKKAVAAGKVTQRQAESTRETEYGAISAMKRTIFGKLSAEPPLKQSVEDVRQSTEDVGPTVTKMRSSFLLGHRDEVEDEKAKLPINDPRFLAFIYVAILLNALQMGLQVDINGGAWDVIWKILDSLFTFVFMVEMVLKIYYLCMEYFYDRWNVMDFFIAWSSILDSWVIPLATGGGGGAVLKMFQFLRLLRMVKVLRMRRDLLALVEGIIASMRSMFWVSLLLLLVTYTAAILCVDIVGDESYADDYEDTELDNVYSFGTMGRSMLTLFSISILDNWSSIVTPVSEVQPYMLPFFLLFLVTTSFGLMNALIGIIVEQTTAATARMEAQDEEQRRQEQLGRVAELIDVVSKIDESNDGMISIEEMESAKDNEDLVRILRTIDLPPGFSVADLHLMLDENGNGTMSQEEFVEGMYQLIFCNEFQRECVAKLSTAQIKKCVFELRQDLFKEMKAMRQHVFAMQKIILGNDAFGDEHDPKNAQAQSGFFVDTPEMQAITDIPFDIPPIKPKAADQEPKVKKEKLPRSKSKSIVKSSPMDGKAESIDAKADLLNYDITRADEGNGNDDVGAEQDSIPLEDASEKKTRNIKKRSMFKKRTTGEAEERRGGSNETTPTGLQSLPVGSLPITVDSDQSGRVCSLVVSPIFAAPGLEGSANSVDEKREVDDQLTPMKPESSLVRE